MDAQAHPGKGLSLSQLVFALNEELKHAAGSPSFTFDEVSQLCRDTSAALVTFREWRNSFIHINRIPLEILSLIPTHLSSQKDRFRAAFVCRHWRRTFLQHPALWSELCLSKGETYMKTLLERAKGFALDILAGYMDPIRTITLLLPHTEQIRSLDFVDGRWSDIRKFSEFVSGPLPLLRILRINAVGGVDLYGTDAMTPPPFSLFSNAANLQELSLYSDLPPPLNHFDFPNLTFFELSALSGGLQASQLLDFLEASPMLQAVCVDIEGTISLHGVPQERIVVLPNVESLSLVMNDGEPGYRLAAHISCPSAKDTSLTHDGGTSYVTPREIFPVSVSWNAIVRQYTRNPVEEVALEMKTPSDSTIACSLTFRSPDATVIRLHFNLAAPDEEGYRDDEVQFEVFAEMYWEIFSQACMTIRGHTLLIKIQRLRICHTSLVSYYAQTMRVTDEVGQLFKSVGPLEELIFHHCDMGAYLASFHDNFIHRDVRKLVVFPPIKELTISDPSYIALANFGAAMVGLAESQHALGVPFERVTVRMDRLPAEMAERLKPWVGAVHCHIERF